MIALLTKRCSKCGEEKPVEAFYRSRNGSYWACCKVCHSLAGREAWQPVRWSKDKCQQLYALQRTEGPEERVCCQCSIVQPLAQFHKKRLARKGVVSYCKLCVAAKGKADRAANPEKSRWHCLLKKYGLTLEEYAHLLEQQNYGCAICGRPPAQSRYGKLSVDHDHATGKVRALLCGKCNVGLGVMDEDPERLEAAAKYLRKHHGSP
jgi:hypothetical protein